MPCEGWDTKAGLGRVQQGPRSSEDTENALDLVQGEVGDEALQELGHDAAPLGQRRGAERPGGWPTRHHLRGEGERGPRV